MSALLINVFIGKKGVHFQIVTMYEYIPREEGFKEVK